MGGWPRYLRRYAALLAAFSTTIARLTTVLSHSPSFFAAMWTVGGAGQWDCPLPCTPRAAFAPPHCRPRPPYRRVSPVRVKTNVLPGVRRAATLHQVEKRLRDPPSLGDDVGLGLYAFSLILNPDGAKTEQQLEKLYSNASRQYIRLWAESGVYRELRQRARHTRRCTRGQGGRREVLRRRLQGRMLLRQQREQTSRIQWQEPLQLKTTYLEMLIKALKANAQSELLRGEAGKQKQKGIERADE